MTPSATWAAAEPQAGGPEEITQDIATLETPDEAEEGDLDAPDEPDERSSPPTPRATSTARGPAAGSGSSKEFSHAEEDIKSQKKRVAPTRIAQPSSAGSNRVRVWQRVVRPERVGARMARAY